MLILVLLKYQYKKAFHSGFLHRQIFDVQAYSTNSEEWCTYNRVTCQYWFIFFKIHFRNFIFLLVFITRLWARSPSIIFAFRAWQFFIISEHQFYFGQFFFLRQWNVWQCLIIYMRMKRILVNSWLDRCLANFKSFKFSELQLANCRMSWSFQPLTKHALQAI